jgi:hypothetical protein
MAWFPGCFDPRKEEAGIPLFILDQSVKDKA